MKFKMLLALTASFTTIGCATGGLTGQGDSRSISQSARQSAAQQHPEVVAEFGGTVDANRNAYVAGVGSKVAVQSGIQGAGSGAYTITTLNSPVLNARSEEHTSELQSLMRISYAVFCLKKKK